MSTGKKTFSEIREHNRKLTENRMAEAKAETSESTPPYTQQEQEALGVGGRILPSSGRYYSTSACSNQPDYDLSPLDPAAERIG